MTVSIPLTDVQRSIYGATCRETYDDLLSAQGAVGERVATPRQQEALQTTIELFERLGLDL